MVIQTYMLEIYHFLREENRSIQHGKSLQKNIKRFLSNNLESRVIHIKREINNYSDGLAKMEAKSVQDISLFLECPQEVYNSLCI